VLPCKRGQWMQGAIPLPAEIVEQAFFQLRKKGGKKKGTHCACKERPYGETNIKTNRVLTRAQTKTRQRTLGVLRL